MLDLVFIAQAGETEQAVGRDIADGVPAVQVGDHAVLGALDHDRGSHHRLPGGIQDRTGHRAAAPGLGGCGRRRSRDIRLGQADGLVPGDRGRNRSPGKDFSEHGKDVLVLGGDAYLAVQIHHVVFVEEGESALLLNLLEDLGNTLVVCIKRYLACLGIHPGSGYSQQQDSEQQLSLQVDD